MAETSDLLSRRPPNTGSVGSTPTPSAKTPKQIRDEQDNDPAYIAGIGPHPSIVYKQSYYEGLKSLLIECDHEYHTEGTPRYNDGEYDALMRLLKRIEYKHPEWVKPDSPSQTVGAKPTSTVSPNG